MITKVETDEEYQKAQERMSELMETCEENSEDDKELAELSELVYNYEEKICALNWI